MSDFKPKFRGHRSYASSAQDGPYPDFGRKPVVGQTKPYISGGQAHGKHEHRKAEPKGTKQAPMSEPFKKTY